MDQEQNTGVPATPPQSNPFPAANTVGVENKNLLILAVAGVAILILIILGWYMTQSTPAVLPTTTQTSEQSATTEESATADTATAALATQGTSDDVAAIDADMKATNLDSLGDVDKL